MYAQAAPKASMSNSCAPLPISSSGVKATRIVGRGSSGMLGEIRDRGHHLGHAGLVVGAEQRVAARADDVVAELARKARASARGRARSRDAAARSRRRRRRGGRAARRPLPDSSGLVSRCASRPITGAPGTLPGSVAVTKPFASWAASASPMASSSSTSRRPSSSWPGCSATARARGRTGCRCGRSAAADPARRAPARRPAPRCTARWWSAHAPAWSHARRSGPSATSGCSRPRSWPSSGGRRQRVIDVRFRPQSRRPGMSKTRLGDLLGAHGIGYEHRKSLGTPPDLRHDFHAGRIEQARGGYREYVESTAPEALAELAGEIEHGPRTALLCLEENPRAATGACSASCSQSGRGPRGRRPLVSGFGSSTAPRPNFRITTLVVVPEDVVHPGLLGG